MRTANVYIDGFNLFYRCLKGTPYKWLDVARLSAYLLPKGTVINRIRYFTARVGARPNNPDAPTNQEIYLRALRTIPNLTIMFGHFLTNTVDMPLAQPLPGGPRFARVIRTDEKGSDVNLATYLLLDAFKGGVDIALLVSNDSDLAEPVKIARADFGLKIWLTLPCTGQPSTVLRAQADAVRPIRKGALAACQFPATLTDAWGVFSKPPTSSGDLGSPEAVGSPRPSR